MTSGTDLALARTAFDRRAWSEAAERLRAADASEALETDDLDRLATAHQYAFTSMLVTGAGRDAGYVVDRIAKRADVARPERATAAVIA